MDSLDETLLDVGTYGPITGSANEATLEAEGYIRRVISYDRGRYATKHEPLMVWCLTEKGADRVARLDKAPRCWSSRAAKEAA